MMIAIPSKGRPTAVKSKRILPSATVFVPESEARDYERAGVTNVVAVPDRVRGITPTRNWILDNVRDRWIVFVDDDVQIQGYLKLEQFRGRHRKLDEAAWIREIVKLFDLTESLKLRIFGVATDGALRSVYPWKPILFRSYVTASFMGIVNDGRTRFDERFTVKEDYETQPPLHQGRRRSRRSSLPVLEELALEGRGRMCRVPDATCRASLH